MDGVVLGLLTEVEVKLAVFEACLLARDEPADEVGHDEGKRRD